MLFSDLAAQQERIRAELTAGIARVLAHGRYIQGPEVTELEGLLADFAGAAHCVSCANGTDALQLALMALNIGPGNAVFVPSFTYTATAEVILLLGARPIFVDSDPDTFNIDFDDADAAITRVRAEGGLRPAVLMTVDLFGQPVDYARARALASKHDLTLISDAAQGFGATQDGRRVGSNLADITTTSFFPVKPLGCYGDGGAIFTDDANLAGVIRSICLHGKGEDKYDVIRLGVNSRLDTLQAAILQPKLAIFPDELERRHRVAVSYSERLKGKVITPHMPSGEDRYAWAQYTVRLENRDFVQAGLKEAGVPTNVYYPKPMHLQPAYVQFGGGIGSLPVSEELSRTVLSLPMHPYLTDDEIDYVAASLLAVVGSM
ncbi:aminotransferase class I/II-fold pyridoxal phosphate-dependent enzyme [Altererythrobacter soli]|uniref:Aminotransferase class I/II-fold pyridoxal phosphate-dependent enzyme n=1 Tax=Croceibacterium soli TaxID=1739690 RepID=A0A6I4UNF0_9SPHN|nr:DegT/DnrJ/EryC1/StrS aminotransferase family protein [Croceibacterium soli]MXP40268.1 aminotransferase class I/II-fold pyridoxal phosphate-dependent enzyme [Croceibacterium soli]